MHFKFQNQNRYEYSFMQFRIETNNHKQLGIQQTSQGLNEPSRQQSPSTNTSIPINGNNFFQKIFFTWSYRLINLNDVEDVKVSDLPTLPQQFMAERQFDNYKKMGLFKMLLKVFGCDLLKLIVLCVLTEVFYLSYPILIYYNIDYLQNQRDNVNYGIMLFVITIIVSFLYNLTYTNLKYLFKILGVNISTHLNLLIYHKSLKYSLSSNKKFSESDIISYSQIDTDNMMYIGSKLAYFIFGLIELLAGFGLLYWFVGYSFIAGLIVLVVISVVTFGISSCNVHLGEEVLSKKDERLSATEELLSIIRFVKQNAYEKLYFRKIKEWRGIQLQFYKKKGTIQASTVFLYYLTAPLILASVILTYIYIHHEMSPSSVFTTMMIALVFEVTCQQFPKATSELIAVINSIKRIDLFLSAQEIQTKRHSHIENKKDGRFSIQIKNGEFFIKPKTLLEIKQTHKNIPTEEKQKKEGNANRNSRNVSIKLHENNINISLDEMIPNKVKAADEIQSSVSSQEDNIVVLKNINLNIERGKLYMIYGDIGSGKSSLLLSILNQYNLQKSSSILINGKISYVSQKPWIFSGTIQSNIEFMHDKDEKRLSDAIKYSCLQEDIKLFPNGKETQIGQNGINLSGGQKFRVDLARSLYSNSDIYLYDDILSAVDIHVATAIMENAIKTYLRGKTIVLVTHAIKFAQMADYIILLKKGEISACQTYQNIKRNPDFQEIQQKIKQQQSKKKSSLHTIQLEKQIIKTVIQQSQYVSNGPQVQNENDIAIKAQQQKQIEQLMIPEDKQKGEVDLKIFIEYLKLNGGYLCFLFPVVFCLISYAAFQTSASILLSLWSESNGNNGTYLYIFVGLTLAANAFIFFQALILTFTGVKQGQSVHNNIIKGLLYANLVKFFNRVPMGRILNRLSKDLKQLDEVISNTFCSSLTTGFKILSAIVISIYTSTPYTLIPIFIVGFVFFKLRKAYISSQNQLIRLEKSTNTPLVIGFTNGIKGATLIRSYKCQDKFLLAYIKDVNNYKRVLYNHYGLTSWFVLTLVYLTYVVNMFAIGFCMFGPNINPSFIGLLLSYILNLNDELYQFVIDQTEFQTQLISLERLYKLMNLTPEEKYIKYCEKWSEEEQKYTDVFKSGKIQFRNVSVRYRPDLPKVINNLNLIIHSGQKVGVVGRTGSGKSTILNTLLQITEISQGEMFIDDISLCEVSLKNLRKSLTVIDQEPVLLNSNFRQNLDINSQYADEELEAMMKQCNIYDIVTSRGGLEGKVTNNSLSAGEKQLVCICRAALKKSKIVLIDQATANIDVKNDFLIQKVIREKFADKTVLMIAHRLSSLSSYDKIIVMEGGKLIQYGSPSELMNKKGIYYEMIQKYKCKVS